MIWVMRNFLFSIKSNPNLRSSHLLICWLFWESWPIRSILLADNEEMRIVLSSILIYLFRHKHWEATVEGKDGIDRKSG